MKQLLFGPVQAKLNKRLFYHGISGLILNWFHLSLLLTSQLFQPQPILIFMLYNIYSFYLLL